MEKNSILKKQELLKNEILDNNFDKEAFVDFCINKKENGDDLNSWTYDEITEIIKEFKDLSTNKIKSTDVETSNATAEPKIQKGVSEKVKEVSDAQVDKVEKIKIYVNNSIKIIENRK